MNPTTDQMSNTKLNNVSRLFDQAKVSKFRVNFYIIYNDEL